MDRDRLGLTNDLQELLAVRNEIDNLLEDTRDKSTPRADLVDDGDSYRLVLEVPGMQEESLEIAMEGDELVVAGVRYGDSNSHVRHLVRERQTGPFQRSFRLPEDVQGERTSAHLQSGLLVVIVPKA